MNSDEARTIIHAALHQVAPEADLAALPPDAVFRDELDIDSMDFLNLVIEVEKQAGVPVPEEDYDRIGTLDGFVRYLCAGGGAARAYVPGCEGGAAPG